VAPAHPLPEIPDATIRPLVVDAHTSARLGVSLLLHREPWVARCLLAQNGEEAADLARQHRPEVALLDVSDAGPFVASSVETLRNAHPAIQIVLTSRCARSVTAPDRRLRIAGFLGVDASAREIVETVRRAVVSPEPIEVPVTDPALELTERDRTLLALIGAGLSNPEIAERLHLGPDAVKKHASRLYRKLGVRNRTEAALRAVDLLAL
jgi:DNA-binding NarL/FixJ family response regulator